MGLIPEFSQRGCHKFFTLVRFCSEDEVVAIDVVELFRQSSTHELEPQGTPTDGSLYNAYHVDVTPTTMHLDGPFIEQSNRVIRTYEAKHQDCFLRGSFVDEAHLQYRFDHKIDGREFITSRNGPLLYTHLLKTAYILTTPLQRLHRTVYCVIKALL
jgi:hypothetical protein